MPHVVAEPCILCRYTECVSVCPVQCFHCGATMVVIDPTECVDCGACVEECPTGAIFAEEDLSDKWKKYRELNARYARRWPTIVESRPPLPTAEEYKDREDKDAFFSPTFKF